MSPRLSPLAAEIAREIATARAAGRAQPSVAALARRCKATTSLVAGALAALDARPAAERMQPAPVSETEPPPPGPSSRAAERAGGPSPHAEAPGAAPFPEHPVATSRATWTPARLETLRTMRAAGETLGAIAARLGVSRSAVAGKAMRLGLVAGGAPGLQGAPAAPPPPARAQWTTRMHAELRRMWATPATAPEIGAALGVSGASVKGQARLLGLPSRKQAGLGRRRDGWTPERTDRLRTLWTSSLDMTTGEIAADLGVTAYAVAQKVRALGLPKREAGRRGADRRGGPRLRRGGDDAGAARPDPWRQGHDEDSNDDAGAPERDGEPTVRLVRSSPRVVRVADRPGTPGLRSCQWIDGDPMTIDHSFCGKPAHPGYPYCADHCGRAYVIQGRGPAVRWTPARALKQAAS